MSAEVEGDEQRRRQDRKASGERRMIVAAVAAWAFGLALSSYAVFWRLKGAASRRWPVVPGQVSAALVRRDTTNLLPMHKPSVSYTYDVDGHTYTGQRVFFGDRLEAQVVMGSLLVSMTLMTVLTARVGFTRLVGLGHIVWVPLLYFLWSRLGEIPADNLFGVWVRALIAVNAVSLLLDAVDVIRYVAGDRAETVAGLSERAQQA